MCVDHYHICQNYNFTVNFYESETQSLMLMKEDRFGMSEKRVVGGIFGLKRKQEKAVESCILRTCIICSGHPIIVHYAKNHELDGTCNLGAHC